MPATSKTPLGAPKINRDWYLDVNTGTAASPVWEPVNGITNLVPNFDEPTMQDTSDYDSSGFKSSAKTSSQWTLTATLVTKVTAADPTVQDPGQQFIEEHSIGTFGIDNQFQVRVYEMSPSGPRRRAYLGTVSSSWQDQGGAEDGVQMAQATLTGQGQLTSIAHPDTGSAVPTISSVTPDTASTAGGDLIIIRGNRFTGTTGVTLGGTACTHVTVVSDGQIACNTPAKSAGTYPVVVTNAVGPATVTQDVTVA